MGGGKLAICCRAIAPRPRSPSASGRRRKPPPRRLALGGRQRGGRRRPQRSCHVGLPICVLPGAGPEEVMRHPHRHVSSECSCLLPRDGLLCHCRCEMAMSLCRSTCGKSSRRNACARELMSVADRAYSRRSLDAARGGRAAAGRCDDRSERPSGGLTHDMVEASAADTGAHSS